MSLWWKLTVFINLREKRVTNPAHPDSPPVVVFFQASWAHGVFLLPLSPLKIEYAEKENTACALSSRLTRVLTMRHSFFSADNLTPLICSGVVVAVRRQGSEWIESIALDASRRGKENQFYFRMILYWYLLQVSWHHLWIGEFCFHEAILIDAPWALQGCERNPQIEWKKEDSSFLFLSPKGQQIAVAN